MTDLNTFGGRFKAFRKSKKLKGEEMGEILRVKKAQIAMIEKNSSKTHADKLIELATAFPDLDLNWLLMGKGEMLLDPGHEHLKALLQSAEKELHAVKQDLQSVKQELLKEQDKVRAVREKLDDARIKSEAMEELLIKNKIVIPKHRGANPGR